MPLAPVFLREALHADIRIDTEPISCLLSCLLAAGLTWRCSLYRPLCYSPAFHVSHEITLFCSSAFRTVSLHPRGENILGRVGEAVGVYVHRMGHASGHRALLGSGQEILHDG